MQSSIGNVKRDIWHLTHWDKLPVKYNVLYRHITKLSFYSPCFTSISKIPLPPPPCWTKKTLPNMSGDKLHTMLLLLVLEGGTYTSTGRTIYKNLTELSWFGKYFYLPLKLTCLRLLVITLIGHILKSAVSNQACFILS